MTNLSPDPSDRDSDFVVLVRPTQETSVTYQVRWIPGSCSWRLIHSLARLNNQTGRWEYDELLEFRFTEAQDLVRHLATMVKGVEGYFEIEGAASLLVDLDRMSNG